MTNAPTGRPSAPRGLCPAAEPLGNIGFGLARDQTFGIVILVSDRRAGDVESYVSATDHYHAAADGQPFAQRHSAQEIDTRNLGYLEMTVRL